jgi:tetratricopeptide (TPR) repeat protein
MFDKPDTFKPAQFYQAAEALQNAGVYETAEKAYDLARKTNEKTLWEPATVGYARSLIGLGKQRQAAGAMEDLLAKSTNSAYSVEAYRTISQAYAGMLAGESDEKARFAVYHKAVDALGNMKKRTKDKALLARAEIDLADMQVAVGRKREALASLQRLVLFENPKNTKIQPILGLAYTKSVQLMIALDMNQDAYDTARQYLRLFPRGEYAADARRWRDLMLTRGVKNTPDTEDSEFKEESMVIGASTNAPAADAGAPVGTTNAPAADGGLQPGAGAKKAVTNGKVTVESPGTGPLRPPAAKGGRS